MMIDGAPALTGRVLVVGLGVSGRSACELLLRCGFHVTATDLRFRDQFKSESELPKGDRCTLRLGEHRLDDFINVDRIIVSPGVPLDLEPLREAAKRGVEIIGELDWACRHIHVPVVAITGTNGKTTTTSLLGEMFRSAGRQVFVGGNIGTPLSARLLEEAGDDLLVLEVSSFQLDTAHSFRPEVGIVLNITEDHLDRYDSFKAYADSKLSIFARQNPAQTAILNWDDPICRERSSEVPGTVLKFSRTDPNADASVMGDRIRVTIPGREPFTLSLDGCHLKGVHNEENIMAAALAATAMGVPPSAIRDGLNRYRGLPHRVELVRRWRGIDFYDDSKATNVGAVVKALENFDRPVLLLLGGRDKLGSYEPLVEPLRKRGKSIFVFGEAAARLREELGRYFPVSSHPDLEAALGEAVARAEAGDVVLLSPAGSSFDQYGSYAQRGDHFKGLVNGLAE